MKQNVDVFKENTTSEIFGALGLLSKMDLQKHLMQITYFHQKYYSSFHQAV